MSGGILILQGAFCSWMLRFVGALGFVDEVREGLKCRDEGDRGSTRILVSDRRTLGRVSGRSHADAGDPRKEGSAQDVRTDEAVVLFPGEWLAEAALLLNGGVRQSRLPGLGQIPYRKGSAAARRWRVCGTVLDAPVRWGEKAVLLLIPSLALRAWTGA